VTGTEIPRISVPGFDFGDITYHRAKQQGTVTAGQYTQAG